MDEQVKQAMLALEKFIKRLAEAAGESAEYADALWDGIRQSDGALKEVAYYHDTGEIWGQYKISGYSLTDILVWQVDHFKAYLDRRDEVNRWKPERLFLHSVEVLLKMEKDPAPYIDKMQGETGTDFADKYI